jgi:hypothetical protein
MHPTISQLLVETRLAELRREAEREQLAARGRGTQRRSVRAPAPTIRVGAATR